MEVVGSNRDHFDSLCWQVDLSNNSIGGYKIYDPESREYKTTSTPEGPQAIADAIRVTPSVTCLDVRKNGISGDGASQLSAAVLGNLKLEKFNEIPIKEMRTDSLTKLDLSGKGVEVVGGMVVAGLLPVMASVTSVRANIGW